MEGFVIRFEDGTMLKIKTNWYFTLNHSLDKIKSCSERHLWKSILSEEYDDIKSFLPEKLRYWLLNNCISDIFRVATDQFAAELNDRIHALVCNLIKDYSEKGTLSAHEFACKKPA
jgi:hypothetical protein